MHASHNKYTLCKTQEKHAGLLRHNDHGYISRILSTLMENYSCGYSAIQFVCQMTRQPRSVHIGLCTSSMKSLLYIISILRHFLEPGKKVILWKENFNVFLGSI